MSTNEIFGNVGSCQNEGTTRSIVVNTNSDEIKDDGLTTLREALLETQKIPGCYNIIFQKLEGVKYPKEDGGLELGYWTIKLGSSLPNINKSNIIINYDNTKTITLIPSNINKNTNKYQLQEVSGNKGSGSLLNVGDMDINLLNTKDNDIKQISKPQVAINNFNFIKNTARGGDGTRGGGGGFGAGGGISLFSGSLKVENSVFQGLSAEGGSAGGSCGGNAGKSFNSYNWDKATSGGAGGVGGQFSAGIGSGGSGGRGGAPGSYEWDAIWSKINGKTGGRGGTGQYGSGGGGGGGGGGRGAEVYEYDDDEMYGTDREVERDDQRQDRLVHSDPELISEVNRGPLAYDLVQTKGYPGSGGAGGTPGLHAGRGAKGSPNCGGQQNGSARGAAIAVHDIHTSNNEPNAQLFLSNVNLVDNNEEGLTTDPADIWQGGTKNTAWLSNVRHAKKFDDELVDWEKAKDDVISGGNAENLSISTSKRPFYFGYSSPVNPRHAKRSYDWNEINLTTNIHDTVIVKFEQPSSGLKKISADTSDFKRAIDELWKETIPDKEKEIIEKYNSKVNQSLINVPISIFSAASKANTLANISSFNPVTSVITSIFMAGATHAKTVHDAKIERDNALEQNDREQERLKSKLDESLDIKFDPIDARETRSAVSINNFEIGKDIILFQNLPKGNVTATEGKTTNGSKTVIEIRAVEKFENNGPTKIANIEFSNSIKNDIPKGNTIASYIMKLIHSTGKKGELILSNYSDIEKVRDDGYHFGPANTPVVVDRSGSVEYFKKPWELKTRSGDDQIYGTDGPEIIFTEDGDDIIVPFLGEDSIYAGMGFDMVRYNHGPVHLKAKYEEGDTSKDIIIEAKNRLTFVENSNITLNQTRNPLKIEDATVSQDGLFISISFDQALSDKAPNAEQFLVQFDSKILPIKGVQIDKNTIKIELLEVISGDKDFYLSYLKSSNLDDKYSIQSINGDDIEGFSLTNTINKRQWTNRRLLTTTNLSSEIRNVEQFLIPGGSIADFSLFRFNRDYTDTNEIRTGITVGTGVGSNLKGSNFDDHFTISFLGDDVDTGLFRGCTHTEISGGAGTDKLEIILPTGAAFVNKPDSAVNTQGSIEVALPNNGVKIINYEGIEKLSNKVGQEIDSFDRDNTMSSDCSTRKINPPPNMTEYDSLWDNDDNFVELSQSLDSQNNLANSQQSITPNQIIKMGRIATPPLKIDKNEFLFSDIKVKVGEKDDQKDSTILVRPDEVQTIRNFNSKTDTILFPENTKIRNIAITDKAIYFKQRVIANFEGSIKAKDLKHNDINYKKIPEKIYGRKTGEKLFYYTYEGVSKNLTLNRQGKDVDVHVKASSKKQNKLYDNLFNALDFYLEADFVRTSNPEKADLKIYNASNKNIRDENTASIYSYEKTFGFADPQQLMQGNGVDIVIDMNHRGGKGWISSWNSSDKTHSTLQDIGHALGLSHPMGSPNSILFNTEDSVMSFVESTNANLGFFTPRDINALTNIWMNEGAYGKDKIDQNLFVPNKISKDLKLILKGNNLISDQISESSTAVGTFKLKSSQFKNTPKGWISVNPSEKAVKLGYDTNKNNIAEPDEAFAFFSVEDTNDPLSKDQNIGKLFDQLSNPNHVGKLKVKPSRSHFDPNHLEAKNNETGSNSSDVVPFFEFQSSRKYKENDFKIDVEMNEILLTDFRIISESERLIDAEPNVEQEYGGSYNYLLDHFTLASSSLL